MTGKGLILCATAVALLTASAPAAHASEPLPLRMPGKAGRLGNERLSDEKTLTRFALPNRRVTIRRTPAEHGRPIAKLHWYTEDFFDEIYIVLESRRVKGVEWVEVRVPGRPNGRTGWVPRWGLRPFRIVTLRFSR